MKVSFDRSKIRILLAEGVHSNAEELFRTSGYDNLTLHAGALEGDELADAVREFHMIGIRSRSQLTEQVLEQSQRLMAIGCFCIGTNQVNLDAAARKAIPVFNAPFSNTRSVAELVLAEAILLLRGVPERTMQMHSGLWQKSASHSNEVRGKTLGIIGYGNIGSQLGVLAEAIGMKVCFYDAESKLQLGNAVQVDDLEQLLATADVVSLHVPATEATSNMIDANALSKMQENAVLINASRGHVVDLEALADALNRRAIRGAAIDVFPIEPKRNGDPFESPLLNVPNVILTPHIGGSTLEAQENIGSEVAEKLVRYSDNGSTKSAVNFPEVTLPEHLDKHRVLHVHKNMPGVMSAINQVLADEGINVASQYLMTKDDVGYVVVDIDKDWSQAAINSLRQVDGTLRTRILF
ncbi:MAG: phosphoglycerate dehydrogenase [Pseudomonadota bacterium]